MSRFAGLAAASRWETDRLRVAHLIAMASLIAVAVVQCGKVKHGDELAGRANSGNTASVDIAGAARGGVATVDGGPAKHDSESAKRDSVAIYLRRGREAMKEMTYLRAVQQFQQAVRLDSNSAIAQDVLGLAYAFRLQPGKAIEHIQKAIDLDPDNGSFHMHLGKAHMLLTDYDGAKAAYGRAIELGLRRAKPYYDLGLISERENRLTDAERYYKKAIEAVPYFSSSYFRLGIVTEKKGDKKRAIELYSTALKKDPTLTEAHYRIAQLYLGQGRSVLAEIHLQRFRALKAAAAEAQ